MRLLLMNLATDAADPVLGFTSQWISALARRVEEIHVITMRAGEIELPDNVTVASLGKERGYGEPRRAWNFYRHLTRILRRDIGVCFSHMAPLFTALAAPALKLRGIPILTWYAHRHVSPVLKLAHHLSDRMLASAPDAYRYRQDKLVILGQGIDTNLFAPAAPGPERYLLSVGRISPIKNLETLLDAAALLRARGWSVPCKLIGAPAERDDVYARELAARARESGAGALAPVRHSRLPEVFQAALAHVNLCPNGAPDKAALEAMACGIPSLAANASFGPLFGPWRERLLFEHGNAHDLAEKLEAILRMNGRERQAMGDHLRCAVVAGHSLERLADALVEQFRACV